VVRQVGVAVQARLIEEAEVVVAFEEAPAAGLPHQHVFVEAQVVVLSAVAAAVLPNPEAAGRPVPSSVMTPAWVSCRK
jgi:hypothetical protein